MTHTAEQYMGLNAKQAQKIADYVNRLERIIEADDKSIYVLNTTIEKLTGLESSEAVTKIFGSDVVQEWNDVRKNV